MRFLYCKLQAKALLALHVYGRQYLHAGTAAVREPALSLSRAHTVYLTLWSISISCFLGNFEVSDKCWLLHFTDLQQIVTSPSHTRTLYLVNLLAISSSNWVSTCLNLYWKIFFTAKKWLMRICRKRPVADLRGALLARTPMAQNCLNFMQFLGNFDKIACQHPAHPPRVYVPSYRESWIRPWEPKTMKTVFT